MRLDEWESTEGQEILASPLLAYSGNTNVITNEPIELELDLFGSELEWNKLSAVFKTPSQSYEPREIIPVTQVSGSRGKVLWTPDRTGEITMIISMGDRRRRSNQITFNVTDPAQENSNLVTGGWLVLNNATKDKLTISTNEKEDDKLVDVRHHKNSPLTFKDDGIFTKKNGYVSFPNLQWDKNDQVKTTSFVFFSSGGSVQPHFGLGSERFNWASNNHYEPELSIRVYRNRGMYQQFGRAVDGQDLLAFDGYTYQQRNWFYRLDIPNNGNPGEYFKLYQLLSGEEKDWSGGILRQQLLIALSFDRGGNILTPLMGNYNGSGDRLIAVRAI